jgi:hypothetical protein
MSTQSFELDPALIRQIVARNLDTAALSLPQARSIVLHGLAGAVAALIPNCRAQSEAETLLATMMKRQMMELMKIIGAANRTRDILSAAGLPVLFLKGPMQAVQMTGDWRWRPSCDLDLLIAQDDCAAVHDALGAAGLHRHSRRSGPPSRFARWCLCETSYGGLSANLDLHWRLDATPGVCKLPFAQLVIRADMVDVGGSSFATLGKVDAFVFTSIHGTRSFWNRWKMVLDAHLQLEGLTRAEWEQARELSRAAGCAKAFQLCEAIAIASGAQSPGDSPSEEILLHAKEILDANRAPGHVRHSVQSKQSRRLRAAATAPDLPTKVDSLARAFGRLLCFPLKETRLVLRELLPGNPPRN